MEIHPDHRSLEAIQRISEAGFKAMRGPISIFGMVSLLAVGACARDASVDTGAKSPPLPNDAARTEQVQNDLSNSSFYSDAHHVLLQETFHESRSITYSIIKDYLRTIPVEDARGIGWGARGDGAYVEPASIGAYGYYSPMQDLVEETASLADSVSRDTSFAADSASVRLLQTKLKAVIEFMDSKGKVGSYRDLIDARDCLEIS